MESAEIIWYRYAEIRSDSSRKKERGCSWKVALGVISVGLVTLLSHSFGYTWMVVGYQRTNTFQDSTSSELMTALTLAFDWRLRFPTGT
jgi:hypothetical protein